MKPILHLLTLLLSIGGSAAAIPLKNFMIIEKTSTPPVIDGRLNDPFWQDVAACELQTMRDSRGPEIKTAVRAAFTPEILYVGFECRENAELSEDRQAFLWPLSGPLDLWINYNDHIAVCLSPFSGNYRGYEIMVNPAGMVWDGRIDYHEKGHVYRDFLWNSGVRVAVGRTAGKWSVEMAIPLASFPIKPQGGSIWGGNFCRVKFYQRDNVRKQQTSSVFGFSGYPWEAAPAYGRVEFIRTDLRRPVQTSVYVVEDKKIRILLAERLNREQKISCTLKAGGKTEKTVNIVLRPRDRQWAELDFPAGPRPLRAVLQVVNRSTGNAVIYRQEFILPAEAGLVPPPAIVRQNGDPARSYRKIFNWDYSCLIMDEKGMRDFLRQIKHTGFDQVNFRILNIGLHVPRIAGVEQVKYLDAFGKTFDPAMVFVDECRKLKLKSCFWVDLYEGDALEFWDKNAHLTAQGRNGAPRLYGCRCYAEPEVRKYSLDLLDRYIEQYRPDVIFFCTKSLHFLHPAKKKSRNYDTGYNPPVVDEFKKRYGVNILTEAFDYYRFAVLRGEFLLTFLQEAHRKLKANGIEQQVGLPLSGFLDALGPGLILDWRQVVDRNAADGIVMPNSRKEYYVFYSEEGQRKYWEILAECMKKKVKFYNYLIYSHSHDLIKLRQSREATIAYIAKQMVYLKEMGGDGVVLHDLPTEMEYGEYAGMMQQAVIDATRRQVAAKPHPILIPELERFLDTPVNDIREGSFDSRNLHFWCVEHAMQSSGETFADGGFYRTRIVGREKWPVCWKLNRHENDKLSGSYASVDRPRYFKGFRSICLQAENGAGNHAGRTVVWRSETKIPVAFDSRQKISIWSCGEDLRQIAAAGIRIRILDAERKPLQQFEAQCPLTGNFTWQELSLPFHAYGHGGEKTLELELFMTVKAAADTAGTIWFDNLRITSENSRRPSFAVVDDSRRGKPVLKFEGEAGFDLCTAHTRTMINGRKGVNFFLKADHPCQVQVIAVTDRGTFTQTFAAAEEWQAFVLPLPFGGSAPPGFIKRLMFRTLSQATIFLDEIKLR